MAWNIQNARLQFNVSDSLFSLCFVIDWNSLALALSNIHSKIALALSGVLTLKRLALPEAQQRCSITTF